MPRAGRQFVIDAFVPAVALIVGFSVAGRAQQTEIPPVTSRDGMVITTSARRF